MLSRRARDVLAKLSKVAKGRPRLLSVDGDGKFFMSNGHGIRESGGLAELIEQEVLMASGDALLPGMTQTYQFNPKSAA